MSRHAPGHVIGDVTDLYMMYYDNIPSGIRLFKTNRELILPLYIRNIQLKDIMNYGSMSGLVFGAYLSLASMPIFKISVEGKTVHII